MFNLLGDVQEIKGGIYDVRAWLLPHLNEAKGHTQPHHFRFLRDSLGVVTACYRGRYSSPWKKLDYRFMKTMPAGEPNLVLPHFDHLNLANMQRQLVNAWSVLLSSAAEELWWNNYLAYLRRLSISEEGRVIYSKSGARWLLPTLPVQRPLALQADNRLPDDLERIRRDEMQEPQVLYTIYL